jgi:hypothetical protein
MRTRLSYCLFMGHAAPVTGWAGPSASPIPFAYRMAIYPTAGLLATGNALRNIYDSLADNKPVQAPLYDFNEFSSMIGFQEVWDFEKKYASLEAD